VPDPAPLVFEDPRRRTAALAVIRRMPPLKGASLRIQSVRDLRDRRGPVHAGSFVRERRIAFDCTRAEFPRILVHELGHFVWLRLGNPLRRDWERHLRGELRAGIRGELGWSAEWRKLALHPGDPVRRSRRWREYCCEAFCDTSAWLWSGISRHPEFTLAGKVRPARRKWFGLNLGGRELSI